MGGGAAVDVRSVLAALGASGSISPMIWFISVDVTLILYGGLWPSFRRCAIAAKAASSFATGATLAFIGSSRSRCTNRKGSWLASVDLSQDLMMPFNCVGFTSVSLLVVLEAFDAKHHCLEDDWGPDVGVVDAEMDGRYDGVSLVCVADDLVAGVCFAKPDPHGEVNFVSVSVVVAAEVFAFQL